MTKTYTSAKTVTYKMEQAIIDFVKTAHSLGEYNVWAALPAGHAMVRGNQVNQLRVIKDTLAEYTDCVGNVVRLTTGYQVIQHDGAQA